MKLYAIETNRDGTVGIVAVDVVETPTTYEVEAESAGRPWFYRRSFDKEHDWRMIHRTPREAVEAFIDTQVAARDKAIKLLDATQRLLLEAACEDQVAATDAATARPQ